LYYDRYPSSCLCLSRIYTRSHGPLYCSTSPYLLSFRFLVPSFEYTMRSPSLLFALFLIAGHFLSLPMTLASPVTPVELLLRRQICYIPVGGCRIKVSPTVSDPFQLPSESSSADSTPPPTPVAEPQIAVASSSESASESSPTSTTTGSSSTKSNAGVALVSHGNLFWAAFATLAATVLIF